MAVAVLIFPGALLKLAINTDLGAFFTVLTDDLGETLKGVDAKPVGLLLLVSFLILVVLVDGDVEIDYADTGRGVLDFRVLAQITDDGFAILVLVPPEKLFCYLTAWT